MTKEQKLWHDTISGQNKLNMYSTCGKIIIEFVCINNIAHDVTFFLISILLLNGSK